MTGHADPAGNADSAKQKQPDRYRNLSADIAGGDQKINNRQRADGVGNIIGTLGQCDIAGCSDLYFAKDLLGTVRIITGDQPF